MNRKISREIALLLLPVPLLLGIVALKTTGHLKPTNPFDPGPPRLELSPFEPMLLEPVDVSQGYSWAVSTNLTTLGRWDVPPKWRLVGDSVEVKDPQLVYRRKGIWKQAPLRFKGRSIYTVTSYGTSNHRSIKLNLATVPRDASEVRLRGQFVNYRTYGGSLPAGWKWPKGLYSFATGTQHELNGGSKAFDLPVKAPGENWPQSPQISRASPIRFVKAFYQVNQQGGQIYLQFHRTPQASSEKQGVSTLSCDIRDGKGNLIVLCSPKGKGCGLPQRSFVELSGSEFKATIPSTDLLLWGLHGEAPKGGWDPKKGPYTLEAEFSCGGSWPLKVKIPISFHGKLEGPNFPAQ